MNFIQSKLHSYGFKIIGKYIYKRSDSTNRFKVVGQLNEANLFFYSEDVYPFKGGLNNFDDDFKENKKEIELYYTKVKEKQRNDFNVSFSEYVQTTVTSSIFLNFLNNKTREYLSKNCYNYFDLRGVPSGYMENAVCFPFFDIDNNFITAQIIKYDTNGKRIKSNFSTNWFHSYKPIKKDLGLKDTDSYSVSVPCFFGENYLKDSDNIVAIVEAPKTAVILKELYPNIDWIATAGEQALFNKNLDVLKDKKVVLFPDAHTTKWKQFAELKGFYCSDILDKKKVSPGEDIADHIFNNESFIFSELHELLFSLNVGEFNFDINADAIKLDFKITDNQTNYFIAVPQYYKGHKVLNQLDNSNDFDIIFKGKKFNIYSEKYELYTAQIDWHRPKINKEKEVVKIDEKDFIFKLQGVFRILKELNPKIYKGVFKCVLLRLRESNFSFNEKYVLNRLVPLWDSYNRELSAFKKERDWKYKWSDSLSRKEFIQELNNHRFQSKLKTRLEDFNDVLNDNRFIHLETDLNLSKNIRGYLKIKNLVKQWNENIIGCKTVNTYFKKVEFFNKLEGGAKKASVHIKPTICSDAKSVPPHISINEAVKITGFSKRNVRDFLNFKTDSILKENIFNEVFNLLNNVSDIIPIRQKIGDTDAICDFKITESKVPNYEAKPISLKDAFVSLRELEIIDVAEFSASEKEHYNYEYNYLTMLDKLNSNRILNRKEIVNTPANRNNFINDSFKEYNLINTKILAVA